MLNDKTTRQLLWIALFAIALRFAYQALMLHFGGSFHNGSDSEKYLIIAREFLAGGFGNHSGEEQLERMPLYPAFLAAIFHLFGADNLRAVVSVQNVIDALSVIGIGVAARSMSERFAAPAALAAAVIPNFLVHASYILTETLFTLFFVWGLCALLWALRRSTVLLLITGGLLFGLALMTRPVMIYYLAALIPTLAVALWLHGKGTWLRAAAFAAIPAILILAFAAPRVVDHYRSYGYLSLTAQEGTHLLNWFYGCLASATPCAERGRVVEEMRPISEARVAALGKDKDNPFAVSAVESRLAIEKILSTSPSLIATSMSAGMFRVLMQTGFYESFAQFRQEPAFLSAMPGRSLTERLLNFAKANKTNGFMMLWVLAQFALVLSRGVQLAGLVHGSREPAYRGATLILAATIVYFLVLTGPVASPKYRIPIEPPLLILFGVGWGVAARSMRAPEHINANGRSMTARPSLRITLPVILLAALALRWAYALILYVAMGDDGLTGLDSLDYLRFAQIFANDAAAGKLNGWQWLGANLHMMPFFTWLLAACFAIAGTLGPLLYVLIQGAADTWTCFLVYRIASEFDKRFAIPAAIAAAINPTQIVMAGLVYSDTPFVALVALSILASLRWLATPSAKNAILIGIALGAAALFRVLIVPWGIASIALLAIVALLRRQFRLREAAQLAVAAIILALSVAPIMLRNHIQYGALSLTPQGGMHLTRWIVPLVKEAKDGTPWDQTYALMEKRTEERFGPLTNNPFESSRRYVEIGNEAMREMGLWPAIKAWAYGAAINMASPGLLISPAVSQLPRTGFFATPGATMTEKIFNFIFRSDNARYAQLLLAGLSGVALIRLIQLAGLAALWRTGRTAALILCAALIVYVLVLNGPVASPKYRLPVEPILNVLTGAGFALIARRKTA